MEGEAARPGYWNNPKRAQGEMQRLVRLKETVNLWRDLASRTADLLELTELGLEDGDYSLQEQIEADARELSNTLAKEEINLTLSGPFDDRPAIMLIHSGAGGTDSQDWAEMLLGMYTKWSEAQRRAVQVMDLSYGDEAGLRGASLEISGPFRLRLP
jgi:peptide chain release factor 2